MTLKRPIPYEGRLDCKQVAAGINKCRHNALRLAKDAQILLSAQRYASAASLAILSLEESGKEYILRDIAIASNDDEVSKLWKDFRKHTKKSNILLMPQWVMYGPLYLDKYKRRVKFDEVSNLLENTKQRSIYIDCLGKAKWSEPSSMIYIDIAAEMLVQLAQMSTKDSKVETKEIELLVKHLRGIKSKPAAKQKEALSNWFDEMSKLELLPKGIDFAAMMRWLGLKEVK